MKTQAFAARENVSRIKKEGRRRVMNIAKPLKVNRPRRGGRYFKGRRDDARRRVDGVD